MWMLLVALLAFAKIGNHPDVPQLGNGYTNCGISIQFNTKQWGWMNQWQTPSASISLNALYSKWKKPDFMIPSLWHSGKGKTKGTENTSVASSGLEVMRGVDNKGVPGRIFSEVTELYYSLTMGVVLQLSAFGTLCSCTLKMMNFTVHKLYLNKNNEGREYQPRN